jgi:hypothetical protein
MIITVTYNRAEVERILRREALKDIYGISPNGAKATSVIVNADDPDKGYLDISVRIEDGIEHPYNESD